MSSHRERAGQLATLLSHPGWGQLREHFASKRDIWESELLRSGTPDVRRGELAAQIRSIDDVLGWPERTAADLYEKANKENASA